MKGGKPNTAKAKVISIANQKGSVWENTIVYICEWSYYGRKESPTAKRRSPRRPH